MTRDTYFWLKSEVFKKGWATQLMMFTLVKNGCRVPDTVYEKVTVCSFTNRGIVSSPWFYVHLDWLVEGVKIIHEFHVTFFAYWFWLLALDFPHRKHFWCFNFLYEYRMKIPSFALLNMSFYSLLQSCRYYRRGRICVYRWRLVEQRNRFLQERCPRNMLSINAKYQLIFSVASIILVGISTSTFWEANILCSFKFCDRTHLSFKWSTARGSTEVSAAGIPSSTRH